MALIIRRPEVADAPGVALICSEGWRQTVEGKMSSSHQHAVISFWYTEEKVQKDIRRGSYSYVAEVDGTIAGVIGGGMTAVNTSEIFVFYVHEEYRYQGIGKKLLDKITGDHIKRGASEQWVSVQEGNIYGRPFYEDRRFSCSHSKETKTATGEVQVSLRFKREL